MKIGWSIDEHATCQRAASSYSWQLYIHLNLTLLVNTLRQGWVEVKSKSDLNSSLHSVMSSSSSKKRELPLISKAEIAKHVTETDAWYIYNGFVYNVTSHLLNEVKGVPGRTSTYMAILRILGTDCTEEMNEIDHSKMAMMQMEQFKIGIATGWQLINWSTQPVRRGRALFRSTLLNSRITTVKNQLPDECPWEQHRLARLIVGKSMSMNMNI